MQNVANINAQHKFVSIKLLFGSTSADLPVIQINHNFLDMLWEIKEEAVIKSPK